MNIKIKKILNKKNKSKIVSLTAYSKSIAKILDNYCDIILVGDSMANVLYGLDDTHKINLDTIINHTLSVKKGVKKSLRNFLRKLWVMSAITITGNFCFTHRPSDAGRLMPLPN